MLGFLRVNEWQTPWKCHGNRVAAPSRLIIYLSEEREKEKEVAGGSEFEVGGDRMMRRHR